MNVRLHDGQSLVTNEGILWWGCENRQGDGGRVTAEGMKEKGKKKGCPLLNPLWPSLSFSPSLPPSLALQTAAVEEGVDHARHECALNHYCY